MTSSFDDLEAIIGQKLSSEQKIAAQSLGATVVSAGAGAGKTTVLSYRFATLLLNGVDADRILTLTFTKKATSEMYERIFLFLSKLAKKDPYFKRQLEENFPRAQICTLDSFWSEIARSSCIKYGIGKDFTLIENEDLSSLVETVLEKLLEEDLNEVESESLDNLLDSKKRSELKEFFLNVAKNTNVLTELKMEDISSALNRYYEVSYGELSESIHKIDEVFTKIESLKENNSVEKNKGVFATREYFLVKEAIEKRDYVKLSDKPLALNVKSFSSSDVNKEFKDLVNEFRSYLENAKVLQILTCAKENRINEKASSILPRFVSILNKEKKKKSLLLFSDVEALAKDILLKNKDVRNFYKNRFSYIMIDEFQDNNLSQKEILYLLSEKNELFSQSIPKPEDLDNKKLFFVGDSKQSIYRFRGADVSVFNSLEEEVTKKMGGKALSLSTNYRSTKTLVEHFNTVFEKVFEEKENDKSVSFINKYENVEDKPYSATFSPIDYAPTLDFSSVIEANTIYFEKKSESNDEELEGLEAEAEYISKKILEITDKETGLDLFSTYFDKEKNEYKVKKKKASFEDIAVLFPTSSVQMKLEQAMRNYKIPYSVVESRSATLDGICYDIYNFLELIIFPEDKKAFLSVLNSPLVRLSDDGLKEFLQKSKKEEFEAFSFYPNFKKTEDKTLYDLFLVLYENVKELSKSEKIVKLLEYIYFETGYYSLVVSSNRTSPFALHFDYIWELGKKFDEEGQSLVEFLDYLRPLVGTSKTLKEINVQQLGQPGVQLMTVHKSKGLGFPIVFLCNTGQSQSADKTYYQLIKTKQNGKDILFIDALDSEELRKILFGKEVKREIGKAFKIAEEARIKEERKRTLYVALTRAKNHFYFVSSLKKGKKPSSSSMLSYYYDALERAGIKTFEIDSTKFSQETPHFNKRNEEFYNNEVFEEGRFNVVKAGVKESSKEEVDFSSATELPDFPNIEKLLEEYSLYSYFGTLVHQALEGVLLNKEIQFENIATISNVQKKKLEESALEIAKNFKKSDFYKVYVENKEIECEKRFYFPEGGLVLEGSVDLIVKGEKENLVVDYKIDRKKNPELHKNQITTYIRAITDLYKKPCKGVVLYVRDFSEGPRWQINLA